MSARGKGEPGRRSGLNKGSEACETMNAEEAGGDSGVRRNASGCQPLKGDYRAQTKGSSNCCDSHDSQGVADLRPEPLVRRRKREWTVKLTFI